MNPYVDQAKLAMRTKLMPYSVLLDYRYKNLCVKTSAEALIPVEVHVDGNELPLEQVAKVGIIDDEHFQVAPLQDALLQPVCQAFLTTHPQLKQEIIDPMDSPYTSDEDKAEVRTKFEFLKTQLGEEPKVPDLLILTTPEVNDDMKKILNESVDALKKQCEVLFVKELTTTKAHIAAMLVMEDATALKKANDEIQEEYDALWNDVEQYTTEIHEAIEEANQRYHERKKEKDRLANNGISAEDEEKVFSMKFGEYEE